MRRASPLLTALILALAVACGGDDEASVEEAPARLPGDDEVLAEVNGTQVTRYDLESTVRETLGGFALDQLDEESRERALQSVVSARAIAMAREAELSAEERAALDRKVARYREKLLVQQYLATHAPADAITDEMVREYYESHPERFAGATTRRFEMLFATRSLTDGERERVVRSLRQPDQRGDWAAWAAELAAEGLPIAHRRADTRTARVLPQRLRELASDLPQGRASGLTFVDGRSFLLRVTGETAGRPRPLADVEEEIRAALGPLRLRDSVRDVRAEVLERSDVVYR
ncbi:MAG TPA: peptidylprolyl isomerase [Polyangiaceae bacterium LLY-WYZ-15_(1-7)]|nr:hypothetical protein [Myxococcales bacterium]MAT27496.1 hypothetical protein [Sandaracinus sp.]HJK94421.1 peptidylprolyl isomerase [Polyangiaceae bacterium LLY-WYZ-15_(1-7)]MBJ72390.1 hypothetical protein [Sandaracinus sp.]HJL04874.1 peptidylprolyl isomerase [Polyangiaceae bacterium LLY-WYZ-15_(1-7)]